LTNAVNNDIIYSGGGKLKDLKVNTGGLRNEKPLMQKQIDECIKYAIKLGMPQDKIQYEKNQGVAYWASFDRLIIGTDTYPLENVNVDTKSANSRISWKGAIAHEIIGHRDAALKGWTQADRLLEEAQASIRTARFTPDLSEVERITLLRDAINRLNKSGYVISEVKDLLHIKER